MHRRGDLPLSIPVARTGDFGALAAGEASRTTQASRVRARPPSARLLPPVFDFRPVPLVVALLDIGCCSPLGEAFALLLERLAGVEMGLDLLLEDAGMMPIVAANVSAIPSVLSTTREQLDGLIWGLWEGCLGREIQIWDAIMTVYNTPMI